MNKLIMNIVSGLLFQFIFLNTAYAQHRVPCDMISEPIIEKLIGNWIGKGQIRGEEVVYAFSATWELNKQFICLSLTDTSSNPKYAAKVYIGADCVSDRYVVHWLDVFGGRFSESLGYGNVKENTMEFKFEYPNGPFVNQFIYSQERDHWRMHATTKNDAGEWIIFGDVYLVRVPWYK